MSRRVTNGLDLQGQRVVNLGSPSTSTDAASKGYVDGVARGLSWKDPVRAASTTNHTVTAPGATVDGVTLTSGDRVLLKNQTTGSENGLWVFNGAASALTRPVDYAASSTQPPAVAVSVEAGTVNADTVWHITSPDTAVTVDTTGTTWSTLGGASGVTSFNTRAGAVTLSKADVISTGLAAADVGATVKYAAAIGDGSSTTITVTHNLGTRDVTVAVYDAAGFDEVTADVNHATVNTVTVTFAAAPASGAYRVVVVG